MLLRSERDDGQRYRNTRETKAVVRGTALDDSVAETIVKIGQTGTLFVITIYRD